MTNIGFLGLGAMGGAMAERLIDAGHRITVYDINAAAIARLVERGALAKTSPRQAAEGMEIVISCLPSSVISKEVAIGVDGVCHAQGVQYYIETATIGSVAVEEIAASMSKRGIKVIDAPVSGGPRAARAGTLAIMISGAKDALDAVTPTLNDIAGKLFVVGDKAGLAQITKLANNMISAAGMAIAFEATAMAVKAGVDAHTLIDVINASTGRNTATTDKFPTSILPRTFDYGGKISTSYKDTQLCLEEAQRLGVPMWVGSSVAHLWFQAMLNGRADDDYTSAIKLVEGWAGVTVGSPRNVDSE